MPWRDFLQLKAPDQATFTAREQRILDWMAAYPRPVRSHSPEVDELHQRCEALVEEFRIACIALQKAVKRPGQTADARQPTRGSTSVAGEVAPRQP